MPTDLCAHAARKREAHARTESEKSLLLLSIIACQIVVFLLSAFPASAEAIALLGQY
jgi:hypothetical protein